jgi:hypothetical protein
VHQQPRPTTAELSARKKILREASAKNLDVKNLGGLGLGRVCTLALDILQ